jgi:ubiquinone/menaquinone biosynthesis C-methylase UbiE
VDKNIKIADFNLSPELKKNGVYILSDINDEFESIYLKVRDKEKRIYSDAEIDKLPFASNSNPHKKEWILRAKSFFRFSKYLNTRNDYMNIMDLGCGNGWFAGNLSKNFNHIFYCIDVNFTELEQGARVFNFENLKFIYADIFSVNLPKEFFDLIILNASVQYFSDIKRLTERLFEILKLNGEIHIIDSPFYSKNEASKAKKRTEFYFSNIGFSEMAKHYHHHTLSELAEFKTVILYNPSTFKTKLKKIFFRKDSPFPWLTIRK